MISNRLLALVDIAMALAVIAAFPAGVAGAHALSTRCTPSTEELFTAIMVWWLLTLMLVVVGYIPLRLPLRRLLHRLVAAACFVVFVGTALPNLDFGSADRSRQKRAIAEIRMIGSVLEDYRAQTGAYPNVRSVSDVQRYSKYPLPPTDPWGTRYVVRAVGGSCSIASLGLCGQPDGPATPGKTASDDPSRDLRLENGRFTSYPANMLPAPVAVRPE